MRRLLGLLALPGALGACSIIDALQGGGGDDDDDTTQCPLTCFTYFEGVPNSVNGQHLVVGDFDAEGYVDLAAIAPPGDVLIALSATDADPGTEYLPETSLSFPPGPAVLDVAAGDVDGDGRAELVGSREGASLDQLGYGMAPRTTAVAQPSTLIVDDFDGDDFPDVAATSEGDVLVLFGTAAGFDPTFARLSIGFPPGDIVAGEFDGGPGRDVAVMTRPMDSAVHVFRNLDGRTFSAGTRFAPCLDACPAGDGREDLYRMAGGDFDGDRVDDLALYVECTACDTPYEWIRFLRGDGAGGFVRHSELDMTGAETGAMAAGRLDDDTTTDVVWLTEITQFPSILKLVYADYFNEGGGYVTMELGDAASELIVHDLNDDGRGDIARLSQGNIDMFLSEP